MLLFLTLLVASGHGEPKQRMELGTVKWSRDLPDSLEASKKSGKPVLLLFQEIRG
ncbi:MAG: hypothetical protein ACJAVK_000765 [Akkermansiaceae bacterium]|jgi:hypothetical protein